jgi:hypothetical protein
MQKFMIISPHSHEECTFVIKQTLRLGISHTFVGMKSGDLTDMQ